MMNQWLCSTQSFSLCTSSQGWQYRRRRGLENKGISQGCSIFSWCLHASSRKNSHKEVSLRKNHPRKRFLSLFSKWIWRRSPVNVVFCRFSLKNNYSYLFVFELFSALNIHTHTNYFSSEKCLLLLKRMLEFLSSVLESLKCEVLASKSRFFTNSNLKAWSTKTYRQIELHFVWSTSKNFVNSYRVIFPRNERVNVTHFTEALFVANQIDHGKNLFNWEFWFCIQNCRSSC